MTIERLDRSKPPPGCSEAFELQHVGCYHVRTPRGLTNCADSPAAALAAAWAHHEAQNDPPGMLTESNVCDGDEWQVVVDGRVVMFGLGGRPVAWERHWRRIEVIGRLDAMAAAGKFVAVVGCFEPGELWPDALAWLDHYVTAIEAVLAPAGTSAA